MSEIFDTFDCRGRQMPAPESVLAAVRENGVCILNGLLPPEETAQVRAECLTLAANRERWIADHGTSSGFFLSFSPVVARKVGRDQAIRCLSRAFAHPLIKRVAHAYLGSAWYVERLIIDRKDAQDEPITLWHADQFESRGKCLKFMLYLGDTDESNGAFCYVPGSHRLVDQLVSRLPAGADNRAVHEFHDIRTMVENLFRADDASAREARAVFARAAEHIKSDTDSSDYYSCAAPAGSMVVFDANGIHRGGVVRKGERFIVRSHCRRFDLMSALRSSQAIKEHLERAYLRWTAPAQATPLL